VSRVSGNMMKPEGWFQIGWSNDFPAGAVVARKFLGEDIVVFRTEQGTLNALDAYCGHMGAHLGYGGTVTGDCVTCPFHGWVWNASGENVGIPYQDRPNRAVRIRTLARRRAQRHRLHLAPLRRPDDALVGPARRVRRPRRRRQPTRIPQP
jgi:3-ketosteroid 9alpha-monooxygenase subunit A